MQTWENNGNYLFTTFRKCRIELAEGRFKDALSILETTISNHSLEKVTTFRQLTIFRQLILCSIHLADEEKYQYWLSRLQGVATNRKSLLKLKDFFARRNASDS